MVLLTKTFSGDESDNYMRFGGPPYTSSCEFQPACLWNTARTVQLSNGMQGVCTLHGIACPSFSLDHDRMRTMGLSSTMVADNYMDRINRIREGFNSDLNYDLSEMEYNPDYSGNDSALGLGMYPTN